MDARNGRWVWHRNPHPGVTVTWSGPCPRGPAQGQGQGEWRYTEGGQPRVDRFSGSFREGRQNGRETYTLANGDRCEGEWRDGRWNGRGTETWPIGARYVGEYRDDRPDGYPARPIHDFDEAVARLRAAGRAAKGRIALTGRTDLLRAGRFGFLGGAVTTSEVTQLLR